MGKAAILRRLLNEPRPILLAGAHNGLGAKLIEGAGFDGVWASSFEISASQGLPDANLLSMSENLAVVRAINEATKLPVVADCDNGYGNAINVIRTVMEYEKADIAGICIEDNLFPKRCSFYQGVQRELEPIEEFVGKIKAAKKAQRSHDFVVIARTEALIAERGLEEAARRARAYADAGADLILAHSKASSAHEVLEFSRFWDRSCPLVAIPTTYSDASAQELYAKGFQLIIFANHGLRAAVRAAKKTFGTLQNTGLASSVEKDIASMQEIFDLVEVQELREQEEQFLPNQSSAVRGIILAAGKGFEEELGKLIEDRPKCLLGVRGKTLLERQVQALNSVNIDKIAVVRGYQGHKIQIPRLKYFDNPNYESTHNLVSLFCAEEWMDGPFVLLYDDIVFEQSLLLKLLSSKADIALVVDHAWYDDSRRGIEHPVSCPELVQTSRPPAHFYRFLPENGNQVLKIGRYVPKDQVDGEFIGMTYFSEKGAAALRQAFRERSSKNPQDPFYEAESLQKACLSDMIQYLIDQGHSVASVDVYKGWMEVDTFEDYTQMWARTQD